MATKAERTRQFIIEQAAPLFNEKGVAGVSIDDVLKATKVAKGCLYGHFENKEELSHAMADYLLDKIAGHIEAAVAKETSAKRKLFAFMDVYKTPLNPVVEGGCPVLNIGVEADDTDPVIRQKVKSVIQRGVKDLSDIIRRGILEKEFRADLNAEEFGLKMFALVEGGMMVCRVLGSNKPMQTLIGSLKQEIESYSVR